MHLEHRKQLGWRYRLGEHMEIDTQGRVNGEESGQNQETVASRVQADD